MSSHVSYAVEIVFNIPIGKMWESLSKFEDMEIWGISNDDVTYSGEVGKVGMIKGFKNPSGEYMEEQLIAKDPTLHCVVYKMVKVGFPFNDSYMATIKLDEPENESTRMRWYACMIVDEKDKEVAQKAMGGIPKFFVSCIEKHFEIKKE